MGTAKTLFLLLELGVWAAIVGALLLGSGLTVSMGSGLFPTPSFGGLATVPVTTLALTTGGFVVLAVVTELVIP